MRTWRGTIDQLYTTEACNDEDDGTNTGRTGMRSMLYRENIKYSDYWYAYSTIGVHKVG